MHILVNISLDILRTVVIISNCHHLVSMPSEIDVQGRDEKRGRCRRHKVQESDHIVSLASQMTTNELCVRMIPSNGVNEDNLVFLVVKISGLCPTEVMHLVHERALTDDGANKVGRERSIVCVCTQDLDSSGSQMLVSCE